MNEDLLSSSPDWLSSSRITDPQEGIRRISTPSFVQSGFYIKTPSSPRLESLAVPSRTLFHSVLSANAQSRAVVLNQTVKLFEETLSDPEDPGHTLIPQHLATIIHLSQPDCPYPDVRQRFQSLVQSLQEKGLAPNELPDTQNYSAFAHRGQSPLSQLAENTGADSPIVSTLSRMIFLQRENLSNATQLLSLHPSFLEKFFWTFDVIMYESGPLPEDWRHFLGLMGASRHSCTYLAKFAESEFLESGGDPEWLRGVEHSPKKLQALTRTNAILAHQPWLLKPEHIQELCTSFGWTLSELVHAFVILATFHSLSSVLLACGILPEFTHLLGEKLSSDTGATSFSENPHSRRETQSKKSHLPLETTHSAPQSNSQFSHSSLYDSESDCSDSETLELFQALCMGDEDQCEERAERKKSFAALEANLSRKTLAGDAFFGSSSAELMVAQNQDLSCSSAREAFSSGFERFCGRGETMRHEDFDTHEFHPFHISDYSWKDEGYALISDYYPGVANHLEEEFHTIYTLTYHTFSHNEGIDTEPFRTAVWHYVHRVQGVFHDDYNYAKVNHWVKRKLKAFLKQVVCTPERITKAAYRSSIDLTDQEKIHLILLASEARKQSTLLYGLRAISQYQANSL